MGGHGTEVDMRTTNPNQIKAIFSNKKKNNKKFGETKQKLPDLTGNGSQYEGQIQKKPVGGFASDSDDLNPQLPMIKGGNVNAQHDAYPGHDG